MVFQEVTAARAAAPSATGRIALLVALSLGIGACTPTHSTLEPYRSDPRADSALVGRASAVCACLRSAEKVPPRRFTTDGCSVSRDGNWADCCLDHDIVYWCGGSTAARKEADARLAACMIAKGRPAMTSKLARATVRFGGAPWQPFPWRWAYGWSAVRGYEEGGSSKDAAQCFSVTGEPHLVVEEN